MSSLFTEPLHEEVVRRAVHARREVIPALVCDRPDRRDDLELGVGRLQGLEAEVVGVVSAAARDDGRGGEERRTGSRDLPCHGGDVHHARALSRWAVVSHAEDGMSFGAHAGPTLATALTGPS